MASSSTLARTELPARSTTEICWPLVAFLGAIALLWLGLINQLRSEWSVNPQYSYGWAVPFAAGYLLWERWVRRPTASSAKHLLVAFGLISLAALFLLPIRIIAIANPDWRFLSWGMAGACLLVTLCMIFLAGGRNWLRYFWFPFAFFLVAVPWPTQLEQALVQNLMRADALVTVALCNAVGTVALAHNNVIELSTGMVGIDDACTGVRSLQATFMISLFLGEFYAMKISYRVLLVIAGAVLAFFCNIVRTFLLCMIGASRGIDAIHSWHDSAGLTILLVCLFGLWAISLKLRPRDPSQSATPAPRIPLNEIPHWWIALALVIWLGSIELAAAWWYRPTASTFSAENDWKIAWPATEANYAERTVPDNAKELLRYDEGGAGSWNAADAHPWMMYYFRWLPGRTAALFVRNHRPDICLPASGITLEKDLGIRVMQINGIDLPVHSFRFDDSGRSLDVFYCYWDARSSYADDAAAASEDWTAKGRLRAAWKGQREVGTRMLELAGWDYADNAQATDALREQLSRIVERKR